MQATPAEIREAAVSALNAHDRHLQIGAYEDRVRAWWAECRLSRVLQVGEESGRQVRA